MGHLSGFGSIEDLTPQLLKDNYLLGLTFVDENNVPYEDPWYIHFLNTSLSKFEQHTRLVVRPTPIVSEKHDYYITDYQHYAYIQLYKYPVFDDEDLVQVRAVYPTGQLVQSFPTEWVRLAAQHGQVRLVPTEGSLSQVILGQGGSYLPLIYQGLGFLPDLFEVDYTVGFKKGEVPMTFLDAIAKLATIELLSVVGDTVRPAGVSSQSYSIDGMSQSQGFVNVPEWAPVFSGRISQYKRDLFGDPRTGQPGLIEEIQQTQRGINMWVTS